MNDDIREKLSAYLDGALNEQDRRAVEVEISRSEEMRLELEALRAVSGAVKGLPKEKLPAGFMARLEARRARENSKPQRDYFILPPSYRPLAFALSTAVVALVIWDRTHTPTEYVSPRAGWDSEKVAVKTAADAPPSIDVSGQVAALGEQTKSLDAAVQTAKKEASADKAAASSTFGKHISAPGKPLEIAESNASSFSGAGGAKLAAAPAPAAAATAEADQLEPAEAPKGAFLARNEEERSAINERLYKGFEEEKKRMGITRIMDKDDEIQNLPTGGRELMTLQASPEAARVDGGRPVTAARGAKAKRQSAPIVRAITLKSSDALQAAWAAAGLPGEPPAVNFPDQMAIFLTGPQGCGIVDVQSRKKFIVVLYKNAGLDDAASRVRAVALSPKPVVIKLAE